MSCEFRIGQKVVCVDASVPFPYEWDDYDDIPVEGHAYTITGIAPSNFPKFDDTELTLAEIRRSARALTQQPPIYGYGSRRFRPLEERRYDISIFQTMCVSAGNQHVSSLPGDEPGSPASSPLVNAGEPTLTASVRA